MNYLLRVAHSVAQANSPKKVREPNFLPGPETAADRLQRMRRDAAMADLEKSMGL